MLSSLWPYPTRPHGSLSRSIDTLAAYLPFSVCDVPGCVGAYYRGISLIRKRPPLGPYTRPMSPMVVSGGGRFLMSKAPLYRTLKRVRCVWLRRSVLGCSHRWYLGRTPPEACFVWRGKEAVAVSGNKCSTQSKAGTPTRNLRLLLLLFLCTLGTGPRRSLSFKLSDTRVYDPQTRARLGS